ncbi:hypothetical protein ACJQWK_05408 [Exserohilum turcicum]
MAPWLSSTYTPYMGPSFKGPLDLKPLDTVTPEDSFINEEVRMWYRNERARMQRDPERGFADMIYIPAGVRTRGMPRFWAPWIRWMEQDNSKIVQLVSEENGEETDDEEGSTIRIQCDAAWLREIHLSVQELHWLSTPGQLVTGSVLFTVLTLIVKGLADIRIMDPLLFNTRQNNTFPSRRRLTHFINHTDAESFKVCNTLAW